jgi:hypothetical protein
MDGGDGNIKKSITIDSASLSGSGALKGKKTRNKTARKIRPSSIVQPSVLKKTLLERIKQHQRTRERSREKDDNHHLDGSETGSGSSNHHQSSSNNSNETRLGGELFTSNFSQSMDFLQKLALKRQQQTNRTRRNTPGGLLTSSDISNSANTKTPEAKMLNQVAETLTNGEIITNTGIVGLPVNAYKETIINNPITAAASASAPLVHIQAAFPSVNNNNYDHSVSSFAQNAVSQINTNTTPNITDLANMYNSTFASGAATSAGAGAGAGADSAQSPGGDSSTQSTDKSNPDNYPIHVPEDPESFLPSIYIKEEPPHGCLKKGNKPTFREWANKMLKKPADAIKNIFGGDSGSGSTSGASTENISTSNNEGSGLSGGGSSGSSSIHPEDITGMRVKIRKTLKKKYRVGKHDNVVGVLLKNKESQRHIQKQHLTLKQKPIGDIKKHLYDKNLLKIGSNAPPDVLRRLYEDSILTGDVKNTNNGVLVHNFFSNE